MEEKLTTSRLLVSFNDLHSDESRNEQTLLELALQHEVIPLSKFEKENLSFSSNDFVAIAFLNDLVLKGYNDQFVLEAALQCNVTSIHSVMCTTYCFESSNASAYPLYNFLSDLLIAGFSMTYQMSL